MKKISHFLYFLFLLSTGTFLFAEALFIPMGDPALRMVGRFTEDGRSSWTGSQVEIRFKGPEVSAFLDVEPGKRVGYTAVIDGEARFFVADAQTQRYLLAEGLAEDVMHELLLFRRSEASFGVVQFKGFEFAAGTEVEAPEAPARKMLVIGDSITCGYGNEEVDVKKGNQVETQNAWLAYAPLAARHFDADLVMLCWSGRGLYRNRWLKADTFGTLPKLYDHTLPEKQASLWDHGDYVPDVVVINLGTNDSNTRNGEKPEMLKKEFVGAYQEFIRLIREKAPESRVFLTLGPMRNTPITLAWLEEAASPFANTTAFMYTPMSGEKDWGGHYHPSVAKHQSMSEQLIEEINKSGGWE